MLALKGNEKKCPFNHYFFFPVFNFNSKTLFGMVKADQTVLNA